MLCDFLSLLCAVHRYICTVPSLVVMLPYIPHSTLLYSTLLYTCEYVLNWKERGWNGLRFVVGVVGVGVEREMRRRLQVPGPINTNSSTSTNTNTKGAKKKRNIQKTQINGEGGKKKKNKIKKKDEEKERKRKKERKKNQKRKFNRPFRPHRTETSGCRCLTAPGTCI